MGRISSDSSLLDFLDKFISWMSFGYNSDMSSDSGGFDMLDNSLDFAICCCNCAANVSKSCLMYHCQKCGRFLCGKCVQDHPSFDVVIKEESRDCVFSIRSCRFCIKLGSVSRSRSKVCPVESPRQSFEPLSPSFTGGRFNDHPSPRNVRRSPSRCDEDEGEDRAATPSSEYFHDTSDVDCVRGSARNEFFSPTPDSMAVLEKPESRNETGSLIWLPPQPHNLDDDTEYNFFSYNDDEDDDEFVTSNASVHGHFKELVSQLLHAQGVNVISGEEDWLSIITSIAWRAASFVKPDTSGGGSMDPCDYVKVKCVASGSRSESKLVKGIVCTKNIKHKRMTSQYKNTRLMLLGGALECQRDPNQLASFEKLLQQENDSLREIVSKIESHRPNVLLVEKSASSFAQDLLLAKDISLVLNVKKPLLERIARCSGAVITPSTEHLSGARLGHCELFHLEKVLEDHEPINQFNRRPSKTLMFFEGCPRRLGCTVIIRGSTHDELKKVKNVVQYAVFAAYHLSLESSFIADEGARLPKIGSEASRLGEVAVPLVNAGSADLNLELGLQESLHELGKVSYEDVSTTPNEFRYRQALSDACKENLALNSSRDDVQNRTVIVDEDVDKASSNSQSILVSFSSHSIVNETICERSRLLRIKFYGLSDKPLGRYLRDDLFAKTSRCRSCKESAEAHAICYTHQHGNLMINVRQLSSAHLPGEDDGKIWMWHRCLRCSHKKGVPPASKRVVMSDAAWGLSFGKFLELSFSKHASGNRVATCGHSLQRDCLRFYGFGSTVACFRYSPINILSVRLPPSLLEFGSPAAQRWIRKEADELFSKAEALYAEISAALQDISDRSLLSSTSEFYDVSMLHSHILELHNTLANERNSYNDLLRVADDGIWDRDMDILEINHLRHSLLIVSHDWDRQLYLLDSLLRRVSSPKSPKSGESPGEETKPEHSEESDLITSLERVRSAASTLSDQIDSAWSGADQAQSNTDLSESVSVGKICRKDGPAFRRILVPTRVYSFDSAQRLKERSRKIPPSGFRLSTLRSFHASGDYKYMLRDPVSDVQQNYAPAPSFVPRASFLPEGARLMAARNGSVIMVYDDEPTSVISYALCSGEYAEWISDKANNSTRKLSGSLDSAEDASETPHFRILFEDDSGSKAKFAVTCYFAKQFNGLRNRCCPSDVDFVRSMSRCRRWSAQGGKSNVYFAKSFDERFIIKQVTKTELDSFDEFAHQYFRYFADALTSGSPTCLAKILGIYQVAVKNPKTGKETRMDVMVMENLFYDRNISKVYDLKGSERSRYNSDTTGANKVLLDMNLLEALRTDPIFLGSKAKRRLERAIWNDTWFLASIDVMDYSLLVGIVDGEEKEVVVGIIDYMRQYTWDKHLETWVKASGILGGAKNGLLPTIVSPKQYKKRFRKAMTTYFLTVPDQWSS
ncbi:putative 1-phosphatidylinositol-3-phosphate 5-kinase FAB1C isoform X2 [Andrographis paniculata]|uniref:putative 1-phosphatidylinositol-3-phosphate 5-kinase FAB1C isoform X2 n=1 Tax=Andrographis paniculata TaxID=175694 RepID=UPI0021E856F0|nr:putative 1-phosphatidylinositol-3-phosphate 5-kinase FAB1C isoform X2 [Andrographis paniculata]